MALGCVIGLFIGGRSSRMGYFPKGLLHTPNDPGVTLVEHWHVMAGALGLTCVLVGESDDYSHLGLPMLPDEPAGIGPLGGLRAFLTHTAASDQSLSAIAVACDMPYVTPALLLRLCSHPCQHRVLAPQHPNRDRWEPLFARYSPSSTLPLIDEYCAQQKRSLQGLLDRAGTEALPMSDSEWVQLRDWDRPSDVETQPGGS